MKRSRRFPLVVCFLVVLCTDVYECTPRNCAERRDCCTGQNNDCSASGPIINKPNTTKCYCDAYCLINDDCCTDYTDVCTGKKRLLTFIVKHMHIPSWPRHQADTEISF